MTSTPPMRQAWTAFRGPGRMIALAAAALLIVLLSLLPSLGSTGTCSRDNVEVPCPTAPEGPQGRPVGDRFSLVHRPLGENGSITVRLTSMTGTITYPPPAHNKIVPGLVPWAKAGVIVKDGTRRGSSYAALMLTGRHGVRMQHDYVHDTAGRPGGVSPQSPRWLRLTRSGDTLTGHESTDGVRWTKVAAVRVPGLPATVQVGMFVTSPGDLTLRRTGLGAAMPEVRFTQATAVFDSVSVQGAPPAPWTAASVGLMGETDWERYHRAPGLVRSGGAFTVTGTGDIGPVPEEATGLPGNVLPGVPFGLLLVMVVAARFAAGPRRLLVARAAVAGTAGSLVGLFATATVALFAPTPISLWMVLGVAALCALSSVFAFVLGALLRRAWTASLIAVGLVLLPYVLAVVPLFPDEVARWLLRVTPAAAFAVQQPLPQYGHAIAHYAPSSGYFPLPGWAGLAVLGASIAVVAALLRRRNVRGNGGGAHGDHGRTGPAPDPRPLGQDA